MRQSTIRREFRQAPAVLHSRIRAGGMTLIELMVAMTISLFLVLVLANLFIGSKQTYNNQDNLSRLQENGRFAIALFGKLIRESGYHNLTYSQPATMYTGQSNTDYWPYLTSGINIVSATEGGSSPDTIVLAQDATTDCLNATVSAANLPVRNTYTVNSTNAQLTCTSNVSSGTTGILLDNVEDLQILYGENLGTSHRYVQASAPPVWANVDTIRVCLLLRTQSTGLTTAAQNYTDCNGNTNQSKTDGRIREAFSETFVIRNQTQ